MSDANTAVGVKRSSGVEGEEKPGDGDIKKEEDPMVQDPGRKN